MKLVIVGTGYVGLVTGACFAEFGYNVTCIDKDDKRLEILKSGKCPFFEPGMDELLNKHINKTKLISFKSNIKNNLENSDIISTTPNPTGLLINGVEILNYKSNDQIYFGPIEDIKILNPGQDYDLINPPILNVSSPGVGKTTALVQPVVLGTITDIQIDPQDFDIQKVLSVEVDGGNGFGASFEPVLLSRRREISFDGRLVSDFGGVDNVNETITFLSDHHIASGIPLIYNANGNNPLGVGTVGNDALSVVGPSGDPPLV